MSLDLVGDLYHLQDFFVTLEDLDRIPTLLSLRHIVKRCFLDVCDSVLNNAAEGVLRYHLGLVLSGLDSLLSSLCDTCALKRGYLAYLAAKLLSELLCVDLVAVLLYNVHHVDRCNDRNTKFNKLSGEVKVTLKVGSVDDVEYCVGAFANQIISCNYLFKSVGRKRVDTGKVGDDNVLVTFQLTLFLFNSNSGPVTHELVRACQCIE